MSLLGVGLFTLVLSAAVAWLAVIGPVEAIRACDLSRYTPLPWVYPAFILLALNYAYAGVKRNIALTGFVLFQVSCGFLDIYWENCVTTDSQTCRTVAPQAVISWLALTAFSLRPWVSN